MSNEVVSVENRLTEYIPFGADQAIKLSVKIVQNMLCKPTRSGAIVDETQAMRFIMMCKARKLNPFEGDAFLVGYDTKDGPDFSIITAHQAFLKRAEIHPEYDGMESGVIVLSKDGKDLIDREGDFFLEGETLLGGWAIVFFKNRKHPTKRRLKLSARQKNTSIWSNDAAGMIVKCAEADALRSSFPTLLGSLYVQEELVPADESPMVPRSRVEQVADLLKSKPEEKTPNGNGAKKKEPEKAPAPQQSRVQEPQKNNAVNEQTIREIKDQARQQFGERAWQKDLAELVHRIGDRRLLEDVSQEKGEEILEFLNGGPEPANILS